MALVLLIVPLGLFLYFSVKRGNGLTLMEKMMNVMAGAMLTGMVVGFYFGGIFHGTFTHSLTASVASGAIAGAVIGLPYKGLPVVEGLVSGSMAGMMGAMTAEMLPISFVSSAVVILVLATVAAFLWMSQRTIDGDAVIRKETSHAYSSTWLVFTLVYVGFSFFLMAAEPPFNVETPAEPHQQNHMHTP
ncbi:hypothetical protein [Alteribacter keqinensis]|uniref:Uncharacterized protein n=1 Tax=Alteribacter keqinensis TaxID=2483800 RepID=A0A3M7TL83_9BACI|nr:hypothetical protein [Alteribacter keqinensis]RNA66319.1 hypothetical protein EBO34_19590 [Alteribacter keqinensis]